MGINQIQIGRELAMAFLGLLLFGVSYNLLVEYFQKRTQRYTAELVVGGVIITVLVSGFLIGWDKALIVLVCFVASGLPMIVGSWFRTARDEEAAKKIAQESLQELQK
jgi:NhaP-type Na+/H+ or K+/H+ antiporter